MKILRRREVIINGITDFSLDRGERGFFKPNRQ